MLRALLILLITRVHVSTYYITHNANGQCDVTAVGGCMLNTAEEVNVHGTKVGSSLKRWRVCVFWGVDVCTACECVCVSMGVCEAMQRASV